MITAGSTAHQAWPATTGPHSSQPDGRAPDLQADGHSATQADRAPGDAGGVVAFGPFHLLPTRRLLLKDAKPVRLGSRALEILIALIERPGELLSKGELMARVWPDIFVEEGNLKVQVAGLRRALGDNRGSNRYLATVPGRGYRFVAPVARMAEASLSAPRGASVAALDLPAPMFPIIDRADSVKALTAQLPHQRFITVVGPGGIGKTTVALAVARQLAASYEHGVRFIDLAPLLDPDLVPGALAGALGPEMPAGGPVEWSTAALRGKQMLLVLDNCEHLIEAAAALVVDVLNRAPGVQILATSREPLRAEGERVHRLPPLVCPPVSARSTAAQALGFPAVQLFVERAKAASSTFAFNDDNAPLIADICRSLDGVPLAIELAAGRIDAFGVLGLAVRLRDPLQLLTGGRRQARPRHQTLRALLDWSHDLLSDLERKVLRRLAVFAGSFTLEAASAVASAGIAADEVVEHVANLVTKSLMTADVGGLVPRYRLLGTTRAYALEKLIDSGEVDQVGRRHAAYLRYLDQRSDTERAVPLPAGRLAACGRRIGAPDATQDWARVQLDTRRSSLAANRLPAGLHR